MPSVLHDRVVSAGVEGFPGVFSYDTALASVFTGEFMVKATFREFADQNGVDTTAGLSRSGASLAGSRRPAAQRPQ